MEAAIAFVVIAGLVALFSKLRSSALPVINNVLVILLTGGVGIAMLVAGQGSARWWGLVAVGYAIYGVVTTAEMITQAPNRQNSVSHGDTPVLEANQRKPTSQTTPVSTRRPSELTQLAQSVLRFLSGGTGARFDEISEALGLELVDVSDAIKDLEALDLVSRERGGIYQARPMSSVPENDHIAITTSPELDREVLATGDGAILGQVPTELTIHGQSVLGFLSGGTGARFDEISEALGLELVDVSDAIKDLEALDLVSRERGGIYHTR